MIQMKVRCQREFHTVERRLSTLEFPLHLWRMTDVVVQAVAQKGVDQQLIVATGEQHAFVGKISDLKFGCAHVFRKQKENETERNFSCEKHQRYRALFVVQ